MISAWTLVSLGAAPIAGAWLHEATHAAVARLLGAEVRDIDLLNLHVTYALPETASRWKDRTIGIAPEGIGIVVLAAYLELWGLPTGTTGAIHTMLWGTYTVLGGFEDFSLGAAAASARGNGWSWWQWASIERVRPALQWSTVLLGATVYCIVATAFPYSLLVEPLWKHVIRHVLWGVYLGIVGALITEVWGHGSLENWEETVVS